MTTQSDRGLKNCRWCDGEPERIGVWPWGHTVRCKKCIASGPHKQTQDMADDAWNTRPAPVTAEVSEGMVEAAYQHLKATVGKNTSDMRMNSVGLVLFTISDVRAALSAALKAQKGVGS